MSKRVEFLMSAIVLGLLLNAAVGFYRILEPKDAMAQKAITDVNIVQIGGKPLAVYSWKDGTASQYAVTTTGTEKAPLLVKIVP